LDDHTVTVKTSFSNEEKHLGKVLELLNTELATTRLQSQASSSGRSDATKKGQLENL